MPLVVWASPLVLLLPRPDAVGGTWVPKVVQILDGIAPHETSWSTTPGDRAAPYAVGCSSVSADQQAALEAEQEVYVWPNVDWSTAFRDLPAGMRTRLNNFCTKVGIARPLNNEVVRDILTRMTQVIDNKILDEHILQVQRQQG